MAGGACGRSAGGVSSDGAQVAGPVPRRRRGWAGGPLSSRPHRSPNRLSPARETAIVQRREQTLEGPHRIGWALGESHSTVHRVLRRHGVPRLRDIDRATHVVVRYERDRPGELVHVDVKKQGRIPDGGGWRVLGRPAGRRNTEPHRQGHRPRLGYDYLHIAVDDRSRVAYVEVHPDERKDPPRGSWTVRWRGSPAMASPSSGS